MRTLYIADHSARIRIRKGNVVVERSEEGTRVPIETLTGVVLTGRAEVSNDALGELTRRGIRVAAISRTGRLRFWVGGPTQGNVLLRLEQYRSATDPAASIALARVLVAGKLQNCRRMMRRWAWDASLKEHRRVTRDEIAGLEQRLAALPAAQDGDTVRGIEGDGSRRYFKALGMHLNAGEEALSFPRRSRRPPRDPVNALLGFVYGLMLTEVVGATEAVGLDPQVGFLHQPRPGRPSLALDLVEEFRPAVADRFVVSSLARGRVTASDFEPQFGRAVYLSDEGRRKVLSLWDEFRQEQVVHLLLDRAIPVGMLATVQATLLARHLRGDLPSYAPFAMAA